MAFLFRSILLLMLMLALMPSSAIAEEFSGDAPIALLTAAEPPVENFFTAEHGAACASCPGRRWRYAPANAIRARLEKSAHQTTWGDD